MNKYSSIFVFDYIEIRNAERKRHRKNRTDI